MNIIVSFEDLFHVSVVLL